MLKYVEEIGEISNLLGKDIDTFSSFIQNIQKDILENEHIKKLKIDSY